MDRAFSTEAVDSGLILGRVKPKPKKYITLHLNFEKGYDKGHSQEIPKLRVLKPLTWWA